MKRQILIKSDLFFDLCVPHLLIYFFFQCLYVRATIFLCFRSFPTVGYTMRDIRYKWKHGNQSVGISHDVELPQFRVLGHRQRETTIHLSTGRYPLFIVLLFMNTTYLHTSLSLALCLSLSRSESQKENTNFSFTSASSFPHRCTNYRFSVMKSVIWLRKCSLNGPMTVTKISPGMYLIIVTTRHFFLRYFCQFEIESSVSLIEISFARSFKKRVYVFIAKISGTCPKMETLQD